MKLHEIPIAFYRRQLLYGGLGLFTLGAGAGVYACRIEPHWVEYVQRDLPIFNLPPSLRGKILVQISDLHIGHRVDPQYLINTFNTIKGLQPDILVITGDFVTYRSPEQFEQLTRILHHIPIGNLATIGILGNHDYGFGWNDHAVAHEIIKRVENAGITALRNQSINVNGLTIIGLDDYWGPNFDPDAILEETQTSPARLVLCHNPDVADLPIWSGFTGWMLSGHTHGGQCKPPFLPPPFLPVQNKNYVAGEYPLAEGRTLYINRGLGHLLRARFNVRPEATVFKLV